MKNLVFAAAGLKLMQELADTNAKAGKGIDKFLDSLNNLALCLNRFKQTSLWQASPKYLIGESVTNLPRLNQSMGFSRSRSYKLH